MSRTIKNSLVFALLVIFTIVYRVLIFTHIPDFADTITACFLILLLSLCIVLFGFQKDKTSNLKKVLLKNTLFYVLITFAVIYGLGFFTGFLNNAYSLKPAKILENMLSPIIIIITTEFIRYVMLSSNRDKKSVPIILTLILIFLELIISIRPLQSYDIRTLFEVTTSSVLPIIFKNCMLTYLCSVAGLRSTLSYRFILDLYFYILPIFPNLGKYLNSMILITLPIVLYLTSTNIVDEYYNGVVHNFDKSYFKVYDIPIIVLIVIFAALVSGFFTYQLIGIGSISMTPKINKGDAVIFKKVHNPKELKEGQVIAYKKGNVIIIHRLKEIKKEDGKTYYITKGDANQSVDNVKTEFKNVKGIVKFKIPFIAYPSVWLSELLEGK